MITKSLYLAPEMEVACKRVMQKAASREDKDAFFQELENIISSVPSGEKYVILGDFNARVGSRVSADEEWSSVRGPHGLGMASDSGKELLSLILSLHQAMVCNTWFEKRDIHKQTWQHPKSKKWSCIDFVVMRQRDRGMCMDVAAKRGAVCNTDHHLVCAKLRLWRTPCGKRARKEKSRRYNVDKLATGHEEDGSVRDEYLQKVSERVNDAWCEEEIGVDGKWSVIRSALVNTAEEVLGVVRCIKPDWFQESLEDLSLIHI